MRTKLLIAALCATSLTATACTTNPETGEREFPTRTVIGAGLGALGGYLLGDLVGGRRSRTEEIVGAGIGAITGGAVGAYMDRQEQELRRETAGTGVEVVRQGDELTLRMPSGITFAQGRYDIQPQFRQTLNEVASTLGSYERTYIDVLGHTSSEGTDAFNQTLSEQRARSVADYLRTQGVQSARIETQGYGETQLLNDENDETERAANRRVEIRIVPVTERDVSAAG